MKKILFIAMSLIVLASCSKQKTYTITGHFNVPEELNIGESVIERGPIDGTTVYLLEIDGKMIDSTLVENETFTFTGKMEKDDAFFAILASDFAYDMIVIEPGEIEVEISESVIAYGTPTNDAINEFHLLNADLGKDLEERLTDISENYADEDKTSLVQAVYDDVVQKLYNTIDSVYNKNQNNLIGVYVANMKTSNAQTVEELDSMLLEYSDFVKQSPLFEQRREYLLQLEARFQEMIESGQLQNFSEEEYQELLKGDE